MHHHHLSRLLTALGLSAVATSVLASPQAFMSSRSFAMGGTGVAVAHPAEATAKNPALMASDQHEWTDDFGLILPSINVRVADKEDVLDQIDDIQDTIDRIDSAISHVDGPSAQHNAIALRDQLKELDKDTIRANVGLGFSLAIPSKTLAFGVFANGNLAASVRGNYSADDDALLTDIVNGTLPSVSISTRLGSNGEVLASAVSEVGIAFAHSFTLNERDSLQVGVSPKFVNLQTFQYTETIYSFDEDDFDSDNYKTEKNSFSLDLGAAYAFGIAKQWNAGVVIKNLIPAKLKSAQYQPTVEDKRTLRLDPLVTVGIAHKGEHHILTADLDLIKKKAFGYEDNTQWLALGAELDVWRYVQLRTGVRHNIACNNAGNGVDEKTQFTAGLGANIAGVRMGLGALYSSADIGAALEFGTAF